MVLAALLPLAAEPEAEEEALGAAVWDVTTDDAPDARGLAAPEDTVDVADDSTDATTELERLF